MHEAVGTADVLRDRSDRLTRLVPSGQLAHEHLTLLADDSYPFGDLLRHRVLLVRLTGLGRHDHPASLAGRHPPAAGQADQDWLKP